MKRIVSVDVLRGLIIVIMALDHTREFVNTSALTFNPEDLTRTPASRCWRFFEQTNIRRHCSTC